MRVPKILRRRPAATRDADANREAMLTAYLTKPIFTWPGDADRPRPHAQAEPCPCGDCPACRPATDAERRDAVRRVLGEER